MRNIWFPKGAAEYMTKQRFTELGLSEAAIGVRDRTFGTQLLLDEEPGTQQDGVPDAKNKRKEALTLPVSIWKRAISVLQPLGPFPLTNNVTTS
jgi:hypothetical protein